MNKAGIENALRSSLELHKWGLLSLNTRWKAFMRPIPVTPYFFPNVVRRSMGAYLIDGYIGVLHRSFEQQWREMNPTMSFETKFPCMALNIGNLRALHDKNYISQDGAEEEIRVFGDAIATLLEEMPGDEATFRSTLECNVLLDLPLQQFVLNSNVAEFASLREFVLQQ